jgi:ligand-binding SRPBCC domain-containing protein
MRTFELQRAQWIPRPAEEVFAFFADPANLEAITPPWLRFRILSAPRPLAAGAKLVYRLRWRFVPLRWVTEIMTWQPPACFVDEQRAGPYTLWQHTHTFEPEAGGTRMRDRVRYVLPFGPLGPAIHRLLVRRDLDAIFDYRSRQVAARFGAGMEGAAPAVTSARTSPLKPGDKRE